MDKTPAKMQQTEDLSMGLNKSKSQPVASPQFFGNHENDDYTLPRATLTQMIKEFLPQDSRMSQQSSDLIIQLSMNFLNFLSDSSNNICNNEGKKTITPSHVAKALKDLKMDCYLAKILELGIDEGDEVKLTEKQTKDMITQKLQNKGGKQKKRRGHKEIDNGMTEEEMIAEQQRLFENARQYRDDDEDQDEYENNGDGENGNGHQYNDQQQYDQNYQQQYQAQMMMQQEQYNQLMHQRSLQLQSFQSFGNPAIGQQQAPQNLDNNQLYNTYLKQMERMKSNKQVDEMNFDEEEDGDNQQEK